MDQTIRTLRHSAHYIANSAKYDYSNGPLEGINRKIKNLKRSCCGFRNFENLLHRIDCIRALKKFPTSFLKQGIDLHQYDLTKTQKTPH